MGGIMGGLLGGLLDPGGGTGGSILGDILGAILRGILAQETRTKGSRKRPYNRHGSKVLRKRSRVDAG